MNRPSPLVSSLLLAGLCLSIGAPVVAQPAPAPPPAPRKPATPKNREAARKHFQSAEAAKARADYQGAATEYLAAYELVAEPAFFYDAAEVYRLAGDDRDALTYYTRYLELDPGGRGSADARTAVDELQRAIAAKAAAAQRAADDDAKRRAAAATPARDVSAAAAPSPAAGVSQPEPAPGRNLRIAGLTSGGVGVVAIGVGIGFGLKARSISNEAAGWVTFQPQRDADGKSANRNMYVFTGIGAAGLVAGGVLYYLGARATHPAEPGGVVFAPSIGTSEIALTARGAF